MEKMGEGRKNQWRSGIREYRETVCENAREKRKEGEEIEEERVRDWNLEFC